MLDENLTGTATENLVCFINGIKAQHQVLLKVQF